MPSRPVRVRSYKRKDKKTPSPRGQPASMEQFRREIRKAFDKYTRVRAAIQDEYEAAVRKAEKEMLEDLRLSRRMALAPGMSPKERARIYQEEREAAREIFELAKAEALREAMDKEAAARREALKMVPTKI